jgi:hypothetical protein
MDKARRCIGSGPEVKQAHHVRVCAEQLYRGEGCGVIVSGTV